MNIDLHRSLEFKTLISSDMRFVNVMAPVLDGLTEYEGTGLILTDDKAPVELLGMEVIDVLIEGEIGYYTEIFEKDGISGLIESF